MDTAFETRGIEFFKCWDLDVVFSHATKISDYASACMYMFFLRNYWLISVHLGSCDVCEN